MSNLFYFMTVDGYGSCIQGPYPTEDERYAAASEYIEENALDSLDDLYFLDMNEQGGIDSYSMTIPLDDEEDDPNQKRADDWADWGDMQRDEAKIKKGLAVDG
jgi:hypothetical protein